MDSGMHVVLIHSIDEGLLEVDDDVYGPLEDGVDDLCHRNFVDELQQPYVQSLVLTIQQAEQHRVCHPVPQHRVENIQLGEREDHTSEGPVALDYRRH